MPMPCPERAPLPLTAVKPALVDGRRGGARAILSGPLAGLQEAGDHRQQNRCRQPPAEGVDGGPRCDRPLDRIKGGNPLWHLQPGQGHEVGRRGQNGGSAYVIPQIITSRRRAKVIPAARAHGRSGRCHIRMPRTRARRASRISQHAGGSAGGLRRARGCDYNCSTRHRSTDGARRGRPVKSKS